MRFFSFLLASGIRGLVVGALLGLGACGEGPQAPARSAEAPPARTATRRAAPGQAAADSATQTAVRFFAWYQRHRAEATSFQFLASATDADTTQSAGVSFRQANHFLQLLRSSHCVSETYLRGWDAYFHRMADELHDASADGDLVSGFDFELVLYSQEGDHYLAQMARVPKKVALPAPGRAVVTAVFPSDSMSTDNKVFYLRRYRQGWLVDSISQS